MSRPPPRPESSGCCKARSRQKESMVEMRSCAGKIEEIPAECLGTHERAVRQSLHGRSDRRLASSTHAAAAFSSSERMRWRISAAAALVKVMATIWPGSSTSPSRREKSAREQIGFSRAGGRAHEDGAPRRARARAEPGRGAESLALRQASAASSLSSPSSDSAAADFPECGRALAGRIARRFRDSRADQRRRGQQENPAPSVRCTVRHAPNPPA